MRLAVLPITSFRHLKGESEIVMFTAQIKQWVHDHPDVWVYMCLPQDCIDQGWEGTDWPRTTVLWETDYLGLYYDKLTDMSLDFMRAFNMRNGLYQIDGLITSRRAAAVRFAREAWDHRLKRTFPVFIDESMVSVEGGTSAAVSEIDMLAQTMGYVVGFPVWDTATQRENALQAARHYLAGAQVLKAMDRGVVIPCGFSPERVDRAVRQIRVLPTSEMSTAALQSGATEEWSRGKEERFTCFFGGRLNRGSKRADVLLREYDSLFRFGRDMDVVVCSPKDEGWILEMIREQYPEIQVLVQTPSDEFKQRASRAHVFMNTSKHEGFSVGFCEMMYMTQYGTILMAPRLPWVRGMFQEKFDTYPFLYESFEQARVMLRWIYENYDEAVRQMVDVDIAGMVAERYDMQLTNEQHFQHYRTVTEAELGTDLVKSLMSTSNRELTLAAFDKMPDRFELTKLYSTMVDDSRAMKSDPRRGQTTWWAVRKFLQTEGLARDTYDTSLVTMEKI